MKRTILFNQIFYDDQLIAGRTTIPFFTENDENDERVTSMTEDQAVRWLFKSNFFSQFFVENFSKSTSTLYTRPFFGVVEPFVSRSKKPGDIDLLLLDKYNPNRAIAFECKRVKATSINEDYSVVNNANAIKKGVLQANQLQSIGFHRSYLMIILLDDSRELAYTNTMMRRSTSDNVEAIYEIPLNEKIHNDVGVVYVKVTQPTGKNVNLMGGVGICIDKQATPLDQTDELTNRVSEFLKQQQSISVL